MARKSDKQAVYADLDNELHEAIHAYADANDLKVSQIIRKLLRDFIEKQPKGKAK